VTSSQLAVLNAGQGDCIMVHEPESRTAVVIDCPWQARNRPIELLDTGEVERLAAIIVTHLHDDHYGGVAHLLDRVTPDALFCGLTQSYLTRHPDAQTFIKHLAAAAERGASFDFAEDGHTIAFGDVVLDIVGPTSFETLKAQRASNPNHASAIVRAHVGEFVALLGGDAPPWRWRALIDRGFDLRADVLVMPHHGGRFRHSKIDLSALLLAVEPRVVVTSVGSRNNYKHPHGSTLATLRGWALYSGARVICTQLNDICRIGGQVAGRGAPDVPCAGDVLIDYADGDLRVTTGLVGHRAFVSGLPESRWRGSLADPHCAPLDVGTP